MNEIMSETKDLTIIIPFLNEREEVENTLKSIRDHSVADIPIIVIDDGSDDGYDYLSVARKYGATYVRNDERMGVADCSLSCGKMTESYCVPKQKY